MKSSSAVKRDLAQMSRGSMGVIDVEPSRIVWIWKYDRGTRLQPRADLA